MDANIRLFSEECKIFLYQEGFAAYGILPEYGGPEEILRCRKGGLSGRLFFKINSS